MKHLTNLFKLLEFTRAQPQYGYILTGIQKHELSNLAEHHYLVSIIALQLALEIKKKGGKIDVEKVVTLSLMHDIGELFGGDISTPYAKANPNARTKAKAFETENWRFLSSFFNIKGKEFDALVSEIMEPKSDEGLIMKIADKIEVTHYLYYMRRHHKNLLKMIVSDLDHCVANMKDKVAKRELKEFIKNWQKEIPKGAVLDNFKYV